MESQSKKQATTLWPTLQMGRTSSFYLAVLVLGVVATLFPRAQAAYAHASPQFASVSCYIICDGQNPDTARYEDANGVPQHCNDARTIYTIQQSASRYVELRYSRKCRMAWARGQGHILVEGFNANGSWRVSFDKFASSGRGYTLAVNDANLTAHACLETSGGWTCTALY